jgi:hypothetical protein
MDWMILEIAIQGILYTAKIKQFLAVLNFHRGAGELNHLSCGRHLHGRSSFRTLIPEILKGLSVTQGSDGGVS